MEDLQEDMYCVVKNREEQYSVWMHANNLPTGWEVVGEPATKQQCLERIEQLWTDMIPRSVREHFKQHAAEGVGHAL